MIWMHSDSRVITKYIDQQMKRDTFYSAYGPFLLKLLVTVKIMCKKKVFQMCNKCCQGCSGEH